MISIIFPIIFQKNEPDPISDHLAFQKNEPDPISDHFTFQKIDLAHLPLFQKNEPDQITDRLKSEPKMSQITIWARSFSD